MVADARCWSCGEVRIPNGTTKGEPPCKCDGFRRYRRSQIAELRHWSIGYDMSRVSISLSDREAGSPKPGDMIARNPKNHADQWLVASQYFADNFEFAG